jgi:CRISPR/Cas system-associated exonuclease Cas4 (RecB family)
MEPPTYLAKLNEHPRDKDITFEEGPHIYTVCGDRGGYMSVTTWNHKHFSEFDADAIITNILRNRKWDTDHTYKYYKMTRDEIKFMWDNNRDAAASAGTKMHYDIECYYNKLDVKNESIEYQYFQQFASDYQHLKPYRTEWMVYYEELKISGSIDMIFENPDGTLQIYDWKRCQEIQSETPFGKYAITSCLSHLPDTNFWHYALQLNVYKMILEHKYNKIVTNMCLVRLHPDNAYKTYERIEVPVLENEMKDLVNVRLAEVASKSNTFVNKTA